ncbi:hypothetical protein [Gordonia polyisoprenivorans]|uniref:hypothetical protein n=1 Tax=Gordonia polyisoprenivorans TaxID=84595 RepID=UPI00030BAF08|nr:hypothetical protein [Gordonia polyisoprenivorans]
MRGDRSAIVVRRCRQADGGDDFVHEAIEGSLISAVAGEPADDVLARFTPAGEFSAAPEQKETVPA